MLHLQPVRIADDMAIGRHVPTADHHATALTASGPAIDFCDDRHHGRRDSREHRLGVVGRSRRGSGADREEE